ncbi:unnamed protein product, partial [Symbiodinium sp. CCMP2456]
HLPLARAVRSRASGRKRSRESSEPRRRQGSWLQRSSSSCCTGFPCASRT